MFLYTEFIGMDPISQKHKGVHGSYVSDLFPPAATFHYTPRWGE